MNEDESMEQDMKYDMMLRTPLGHSPNRSEGTTMDQEVTRVKIGTSGTSTPIMTVRGDLTRLSMTSNKSEAAMIKDEFWPSSEKESNMTSTVAFKAPIATHDSETTIVAMTGASNNSNNTKITTAVEANGEAIKEKNDDSTNGLSGDRGSIGNNNLTSSESVGGGGGQTNQQNLDAISPQSDSGIRTSLLNKECGR